MANSLEKMKCVSQQELRKFVDSGLSYVRVSFQNETEPVYLIYNDRPGPDEISEYLEEKLGIFEENKILTWSENK